MERAHDVVLDASEFDQLEDSLTIVRLTIMKRVEQLQSKRSYFRSVAQLRCLMTIPAIYQMQNIKKEDKLPNIFFGLVCAVLRSIVQL